MRHTFALFLACGTALCSYPAFAVDGTAFAERLKTVYAAKGGGGEIIYESVETADENVTLKGAKIKSSPDVEFAVGDILFEGVSEDEGEWLAELVSIPDISTTSEESTLVLKGFVIENLIVPAEDDSTLSFPLYDRAAIEEASVSIDGKPSISMKNYEILVEAAEPDVEVSFTSEAESIYVDVADMATAAKSLEGAKALGLEKIDGTLIMNGSWLAENGAVEVSELSFDVPDAGRIGFSFSLEGYTSAFMQTLQEVTKTTASAGSNEQAEAAQGLAMLGLMQQLSFVSTQIRYDDAGLANRAIDYAAKQQNTTREALVAQGKAMLPLMLGQLQNPEFATAVSAAVSTFLDNPKSLEIDATPAAPVPGTLLMATGAGNPMELIKTLNVVVKANE